MDFKAFKSELRDRGLVHLVVEVPADLLTPAAVFLRLNGDKAKASFLLESVEAGENIGRYSIIGVDPIETVTLRSDQGVHSVDGRRHRFPREGFLDLLRARLQPQPRSAPADLTGLLGGWIGYFGYDCAHLFERLPSQARDVLGHPWAMLGLYEQVVLFDHARQAARAVVTIRQDGKKDVSLRVSYDQAQRTLTRLVGRMERSAPLPGIKPVSRRLARSNMSPDSFRQGVRTFKKHIGRGDIFQGVLSQRFGVDGVVHPFDAYRRLRRSNPSPYMYFLRFGDFAIAGSSPETLVQKSGEQVKTRPIAGTRPRGGDASEDQRHERNLLASSKENAEHVMLVDLGRNDLGRVCWPGSVTTDQFRAIDRYSHVMHMVSTVTGRSQTGVDAFRVLGATFPAGTVTGAPKIRAMELIDSVEPDRRGVYAGCVGYVDWYDNFDVAIAIRTAVMNRDGGSVQAGAGIVADSDPEREYIETCNKAAAPLSAMGAVIKGRD